MLYVHKFVEKETSRTLSFDKIVENTQDTENVCEFFQKVVDNEHNNDKLMISILKPILMNENKLLKKRK